MTSVSRLNHGLDNNDWSQHPSFVVSSYNVSVDPQGVQNTNVQAIISNQLGPPYKEI